MTWQTALFAYLALGGAFIGWQSREWWLEMERHWTHSRKELRWPLWFVIAICAVSLVCDVALWPRSATVYWKRWRKQRRWEKHGDFCHCEKCDSDEG